jgi:hypothetical protein
LGRFQPVDERVDAGGESLVTVVDPDVLAEGDQGGEPVTGKRPEEFVEPFSGFLAVSSGFGDQVDVVPAWCVDEGVIVSLAA